MARKLRLEYPGAIYHVIDRGNYRADIIGTDGAKAAFEACLFAVCKRAEWLLHAYVPMRNHVSKHVGLLLRGIGTGRPWLEKLAKEKGTT